VVWRCEACGRASADGHRRSRLSTNPQRQVGLLEVMTIPSSDSGALVYASVYASQRV